MAKFLHLFSTRHLMLFFIVLYIAALISSPFLLSVSMFALAILSVFELRFEGRLQVRVRQDFLQFPKRLRQSPDLAVISLFFWLVLFSGLGSADMDYYLVRLRLKVPFLVFPIVFLSLPPLKSKEYLGIFYFLVVALCVTCIGIGVNYLLHFEEINELIKKGQPIPVPRNHIRFSLLLAIGIIAGYCLYAGHFYLKHKWERHAILGMTAFLFLFIHVLAVRSGLAVLYAAILLLTIQYIIRSRKYWIGLVVLGGLTLLPILAYQLVPSFQNKIKYMRYDRLMHDRGEGAGLYSDSDRLLSIQIGWRLFLENPIWGVGAGDLRKEVNTIYEQEFPDIEIKKKPHNQYVSVLAGSGIVGFLVFLVACFYPLIYRKNYKHFLLYGSMVILLISFLVENTIENSNGIGIYILFVFISLKYIRESKALPEPN